MDISVQDLTSVDKEVILKAKREDLQDKFDSAYRSYKGQMALPGFRPGKVPIGLIKKRFGKEIEFEEINKYVQEVFEKEVIPKYEPIGETQMVDLQWEDDNLEVKFKIGAKPEFEMTDLEKVKVDKMVHDVSDEDVEEELQRTLEREGNWVEKKSKATKKSRLIVDVSTLGEDGEPVPGEQDVDQQIDLRQEGAAEFRDKLVGKKAGDVVDMELGEGDDTDRFRVTIKKVEEMESAELTDELIKAQSNGEAENKDEFKSYLKSRIQEYYDQSSGDLFKNDIVDALVSKHDFEVPEVFIAQLQNSYVEQMKQQHGEQLPPSFDEEEYKSGMTERAIKEARWHFISQKLQETFDDIEIKPEDIDEFISMEAARYGASVDQMKQYYAKNPNLLEQLRSSIRENKVFDKLQDIVKINEISKEKYRKQQEKKSKK